MDNPLNEPAALADTPRVETAPGAAPDSGSDSGPTSTLSPKSAPNPQGHTGPQPLAAAALTAHEPALLRYAHHLLHDAARAQDVVQDTFAKYWSHPPPPEVSRPENPGRLKAWLFTVCRNRAFDVMRKDRRMTSLSAPISQNTAHPSPSPARVAEQRDTHAAVLDRVAALPDHQQEVVRLKFQAGLTYQQIADVTGLTRSHVGYLLHHALKTLRQQMAALE